MRIDWYTTSFRVAILCWLTAVCGNTSFAASPTHKQIDAAIKSRAGGAIAAVADDAEFLRRVSLDLNGSIPTADEARKFLTDKNPNKRAKLLDRLLAKPQFARRMREAFTVMLLERRAGKTVTDKAWNTFLEASFAKNKPWDKFVAEILAADGRDERTAAGMRFFVDGGRNSPNQMTRDVGRLFLGMDLQCAQCHDHPNVKPYKQSDYFGLFAFVSNSKLRGKYFIATPNAKTIEFQSVFDPDNKKKTGPRLPEGKEIAVPTFKKKTDAIATKADKKTGLPAIPKFRPRLTLAKQLASASNQRFVRNSVNRFWFLMMGRGLVQPLDFVHRDNPPSHPKLLDLLAREFVAHKFDVKWLIRELALTRAYQRSSRLPKGVKPTDVKPGQYRVVLAKSMSAEQMAWSLMQATGRLETIVKTPRPKDSKFTVKDYVNNRIPPPGNLTEVMMLFAGIYGNPPGEAEVEFNPSAEHALFLMNDRLIIDWLKPKPGNLTDRLTKQKDVGKLAEELYLSVLTRFPTAAEKAEVAKYLNDNKTKRAAAVQDLAWALFAATEFRLNH